MSLLARAAEAGIHCLAIPTPFAVGRVNCWLIEDEPLTLLDTGPLLRLNLEARSRELMEAKRDEVLELIRS